ncbi:transporter substrate-binding domain-containing protein [Vibrio sp. S4M6]|uniref:substrate-binding periplasmic protein n=1 Tax=Vibrio sinus TaxID=2946865 RepID=UPI00202A2502|nr:transporter substrate-binding domain-containing protein [Vibrio sinus]MCL9781291.1 transporter substrate-binding domain-containing protein [Vibrio sinus]
MKKLIIALIAMMTWSGYSQAENKISFCFDPWPPVHELNGNGEPEGLFIDIVKVIFEKNLKMEVEYLQLPWKRCQSYVADGTADFMITVQTPERSEYSVGTEKTVYDMYNSVYTYKGNKRLAEIKKISKPKDVATQEFTVVTYLGNGWYKKNFSQYHINTTYLNNIEPAIQFLATKRADLYIGGEIVANYQIKRHDLQDKIVNTKIGFDPYLMRVMMSKKSKFIENLPEINKELNAFLLTTEYQDIVDRYSLEEGN